MTENVGRTRLLMKNGTGYVVLEDLESVFRSVQSLDFVTLNSVTGQAAFPPEALVVRSSEVTTMQTISEEAWVWQQRADELHYSRPLQEATAMERQAAASERLAAALEGHEGHES